MTAVTKDGKQKKVQAALDTGISVASAHESLLFDLRDAACPPIRTGGGTISGYKREGELLTRHHFAGFRKDTFYVSRDDQRPSGCAIAASTEISLKRWAFDVTALGRLDYDVEHEPVIRALPAPPTTTTGPTKVIVDGHGGRKHHATWDGHEVLFHGARLAHVCFSPPTTPRRSSTWTS